MTIKEFEQSLLNCLNRMNNDKIKKNKYAIKDDYGIIIDGQSYWIPPAIGFHRFRLKKK